MVALAARLINMSDVPARSCRSEANREKRRVALSSLAAAVLLVSLKLVVGVWTNSLGIFSEAAHSAFDLVAAAMTYWAVRVASQPADHRHTYGHGKFENLSALGETALLLATCGWIIFEAFHRLLFATGVNVEVNVWAFVVLIISIVVDYSRSRALGRAAERHQSQALEADALHFSTDIWSSLVVIFGLVGVVVAKRFDMPWLAHADGIAALGVAGIVIWVSIRLGRKSIDDLVDSIPQDLQEAVVAAAAAVPGVESVKQVRVRRSGGEIFADATLTAVQTATFEKTHTIADEAEAAIRAVLPNADVVIHLEPVPPPAEDLLATVRVLAARHGLGAHGVRIYEEGSQRSVELHLEVNESLRLEEAHRQVSLFEDDLRGTVADLARITSHIEPAGDTNAAIPVKSVAQAAIEGAVCEFFSSHPAAVEPHDIQVQQAGDELAVSLHCALDGATAITDAHGISEELERYLRARVPEVGRVVIHVEPQDAL